MNSQKLTLALIVLLAFAVVLSKGKVQEILERIKIALANKGTDFQKYSDKVRAAAHG